MRLVEFFQRFDFVGGEFDGQGGDGVVEVVRFGGADDRRGDNGFVQEPGHSEVRGRDPALFRQFVDAVNDGFVQVHGFGIEALAKGVGLGAVGGGFGGPGACEAAAGER